MLSTQLFIRRHKRLALAVALATATVVGPAGQAWAQGAGGTATATVTSAKTLESADRKFIEEAAQGGLAEVTMGQMAQQRASNAQVKAYGQRMVADHGKANEELKRVASAKGVQVPATLSNAHQADADKLSKLSGAEFDRAYMKHMVKDHKKDISDFEKAAKNAKDPEVKDFAARTLPTLQAHLQLAQTTQDAVK